MESIQVRLHKVYSSSECVRKTPDLPSHQNPFHSFRQIIRQTFSVVSVSSSVNDHSALSCSARVLALLVYVICVSKEIDSYYDSKLLFLPCHLQRGTWNTLIFVGNTKYRSQEGKKQIEQQGDINELWQRRKEKPKEQSTCQNGIECMHCILVLLQLILSYHRKLN